MTENAVIRAFADAYESHKLWQKMLWRGKRCWKTPEDMWLYTETLWELKPQLLVEFGTGPGGTAEFFADVLSLIGDPQSRVITVDQAHALDGIDHARVTQLIGEVRSPEVHQAIVDAARAVTGHVLFIEDSSHEGNVVACQLAMYRDLVTVGSYFIVEDLDWPEVHSPVRQAVDSFLADNPDFAVDPSKSKYLFTNAPGGWLRRVA